MTSGNLFADIPDALADELFTPIHNSSNVRIERIVSRGHASAPGFWCDQDWAEWVLVLAGSATITMAGESVPRVLRRGDHLHIPARARHRVEWTDPNEPTIWLAVHYR